MANHQNSVLDSLQWDNRPLDHETRQKTQSHRWKWYKPHKVLPWKEFTLKTLKSIDGGRLLRVAAETRSLWQHYPTEIRIPRGVAQAETDATATLNGTSYQIVQNALDAVENELPTCEWTHFVHVPSKAERRESAKSTPFPAESTPGGSPITSPSHLANIGCQGGNRQHPDLGANIRCQLHGLQKCRMSTVQRLPKDVKPSSWESYMVTKACLEEDGTWIRSRAKSSAASPVKQAFTYCVIFDCRYGCILTTKEAFIFQVRLCTAKECPNVAKIKNTRAAYEEFGKMEYITLPWSTEGLTEPDENTDQVEIEAVDPYSGRKKTTRIKHLTYNLALWAVHVLAASRHRLQDNYDHLEKEKLVFMQCDEPRALRTPESIARPGPSRQSDTRGRSRSRKRASDHYQPDEPVHSTASTNRTPLPSRHSSTHSLSSGSDTEKEDGDRGHDWTRTTMSQQNSSIRVRGSDGWSDSSQPEDRPRRTKRRRRQ